MLERKLCRQRRQLDEIRRQLRQKNDIVKVAGLGAEVARLERSNSFIKAALVPDPDDERITKIAREHGA